jgi:peptidoglycan hydrolase-like protein with peptidoglycan-binding domain
MRYNNSSAYALAVGHLADRLRGGDAFQRAWPSDDRLLAGAERMELQRLLRARGFGVSKIDGKIGPNTRRALRAFQARIGMVPDGFATKSVLDRLRQAS